MLCLKSPMVKEGKRKKGRVRGGQQRRWAANAFLEDNIAFEGPAERKKQKELK